MYRQMGNVWEPQSMIQATHTRYEKATSGLQEVVHVVFFGKKLGLQNFFYT